MTKFEFKKQPVGQKDMKVEKDKKKHFTPQVTITKEDIDSALNQKRKDPVVFAFAGKMDTCKSGMLCDIIVNLPEGKVGVVFDLDHSIIPIIDEYYNDHRDKFLIINATGFGKDYKKGLLVGLAALEHVVKERGSEIGLIATEGMDRLYQRSFKITCKARGYDIEDLRFFGKGGETEFTPTDWMIRNDYNVEPFDLMYNYAAQLGINFIMTTHTQDKINSRHEVVSPDEPIWYKTIPDYISYLFITDRKEIGDVVRRSAICKKARVKTDLFNEVFPIQEFNKKTKKVIWHSFYEQLKEKGLVK